MRLKKVNLKRVLCALLASAMVVVPVTPASAATARATTMKLEKAEGSVTLKTQNGSARKITNGMRLYNGNALSTASSSYAYISLDSTKAVKLDQNSSATLRQNGQQLELLVKSGKMFFNVSQPLTEKENMNVRTSTMVTGIRGTCGVVEYVNVNKSRLYLLEGKVTLGSGENATTIYGGQTATVVLQPKKETDNSGKPGDMNNPEKEKEQKVLVEKMTEKTVPVFAIAEIVSDPVLQKKITKTTNLKIEKLEEILEASKQEEEEKEPEKTPEETTPSGGGSSTPSTPVVTDATLTGNVSAAAINAALATYNKVTIAADAKAELEADVKIPEGKTLQIASKETQTGENQYSGSMSLLSGAKIILEDGASLVVSGTISGNGIIGNENAVSNSKIKVEAGGTVRADLLQLKGGSVENDGTIDVGTISVAETGMIQNSNLIKTQKYTGTGYTYSEITGSVLICNNDLTSNLNKASLLVTAMASGSDMTEQQYFYAKELNPLMAQRINDIKNTAGGAFKEKGASSWTFKKEAVVNSKITIDFAGATVVMGVNQMTIAAGVTLKNIGNMTGSGTAVISLQGTGTLTLDRTIETSGTISNTNTGKLCYAIAVASSSNPLIIWNDDKLTIESVKETVADTNQFYIIEGCNTTENSCYFVKDWLKCKENYSVKAEKGVAILVPVEQQSGSGS